MANQDDWIKIEVTIPAKYFIKETEKAICFKLWDVKFIPIPRKFAQDAGQSGNEWIMFLPKWYIQEHSLRSLVAEEDRHLVPTKTELKKLAKLQQSGPLLEGVQPLEALEPLKPYATYSGGHKSGKSEAQKLEESEKHELSEDDAIPW